MIPAQTVHLLPDSCPRSGWSIAEVVGLAVSLLITTLLTLPFLNSRSFWFDEVFTMTVAQTDWTTLFRMFVTYENNMALYYIIMHGWVIVAGDSEFSARILSLLFALTTLPVVHLLARRLFDTRVAIIADLLLSMNTLFLLYAQEARSYSLLLLLSALSVLLFVESLRQPRWYNWIGFCLVGAASVYVHYFGMLTVVACFAATLWRRPWPWQTVLGAGCCFAVLLVPLMVLRPPNASQIDWLPRPGLKMLSYCCSTLTNHSKILGLCFVVLVVVGLMGSLRMRSLREPPKEIREKAWPFVLLMTWVLLPILSMFFISWLIKPLFLPRYFIGILPAVVILVAVGLARLPTFWSVVALSCMLLPFGYRHVMEGDLHAEIDDWRGVTAKVVEESQPGDTVICFAYHSARAFQYYAKRQLPPHPELVTQEFSGAPYHPGGGSSLPQPDLNILSQLAITHPRIWLVETAFFEGLPEHTLIVNELMKKYKMKTLVMQSTNVHAILFFDPIP